MSKRPYSDTSFVKLLKQEFHGQQLSKIKWIPEKFIDKNFGWYHITLQTNDMQGLKRSLYFVPVRMLVSDKNNQIYTKSYRIVPEGKDWIYDYQHINNNFHMINPNDDDEDIVNFKMENFDKSDEIVAYPIIRDYQFIGYLCPNSVLDETFLVREQFNPGKHISCGFYRKEMPQDQVIIFSRHPWEEIQKKLKYISEQEGDLLYQQYKKGQ